MIGRLRFLPRGREGPDTVAVGVAARRERLAHAGRANTQADVTEGPYRVGEFDEAAVFLGDNERIEATGDDLAHGLVSSR